MTGLGDLVASAKVVEEEGLQLVGIEVEVVAEELQSVVVEVVVVEELQLVLVEVAGVEAEVLVEEEELQLSLAEGYLE